MVINTVAPRAFAGSLKSILTVCGVVALTGLSTFSSSADETTETHVMPKGQTMKGPAHLKKSGNSMPSGPHEMSKGGAMGTSKKKAKAHKGETASGKSGEQTHVMPKGQIMKGAAHLKKDSSSMPEGKHSMPRGGTGG